MGLARPEKLSKPKLLLAPCFHQLLGCCCRRRCLKSAQHQLGSHAPPPPLSPPPPPPPHPPPRGIRGTELWILLLSSRQPPLLLLLLPWLRPVNEHNLSLIPVRGTENWCCSSSLSPFGLRASEKRGGGSVAVCWMVWVVGCEAW